MIDNRGVAQLFLSCPETPFLGEKWVGLLLNQSAPPTSDRFKEPTVNCHTILALSSNRNNLASQVLVETLASGFISVSLS